jgi:hypothetical protein
LAAVIALDLYLSADLDDALRWQVEAIDRFYTIAIQKRE